MIASVQIASAARAFPDAAPVSSAGSEASTPANFQSVLRQYDSLPEHDSEQDTNQDNSQQTQKDSTATPTVATQALPVTQTIELRRSILPLTVSTTLRQDATALQSSSAAALQSSSAAAPNTTLAPETDQPETDQTVARPLPKVQADDAATALSGSFASAAQQKAALASQAEPTSDLPPAQERAATGTSRASGLSAYANFQNALYTYQSSRKQDSASDVVPGSGRNDSNPTRTIALVTTQTAEPPRPILTLTASTTLRQHGTASLSSSAAPQGAIVDPETDQSAAPPSPQSQANETVTVPLGSLAFVARQNAALVSKADPTSALPPTQEQAQDTTGTSVASAALAYANFQSTYKYRSLRGQGSGSDAVPGSGSQDTDLTRTVVFLTTQTVEPPRPILPLTASLTLRQDGTASPSSSAAALDTGGTPEADQPVPLSPPQMQADETATGPSGSFAFAARLSPNAETQAPAPDALPTAEQQPRAQTSLQTTTQAVPKQVAAGVDESADARSGEGGDSSPRQNAGDLFAKPDALSLQTSLGQTSASAPDHAATSVRGDAGNNVSKDTLASPMSLAARMDKVIEPPTAPASTNHDITIRIPDATDQGTAVRFVERGGEVHVSVRTGDAEMAQTLRGGLNDLVNRLQDGGIRTELWQPGSDASSSRDDLPRPFADPDGSNGQPPSSGSNSEQESNQQNKPRWVEELESSIGNENSKETPQLLWQA